MSHEDEIPSLPCRAFLRDIHCRPGEVGNCKIVAMSIKPGHVIVEWPGDHVHAKGAVDVLPLADLQIVRREDW